MNRRLWFLLIFGALMLAILSSCGQVITLPTPTPTSSKPVLRTPTGTPSGTRTATPAPYTPAPTDTPTVTPTPIFYEVQPGDTLIGIAHRYGVSLASLQEANGIIDPRTLSVGQRLVIPREELKQTNMPTPTPLPATPAGIHFARMSTGGLWCMGEIVNGQGNALEDVLVSVRLLDESGRVVMERSAPVQARIVEPGKKAPFVVEFPNAYPKFSSYQVVVLRALPAHHGRYYFGLRVENVGGAETDKGVFSIDGKVRNVGGEDAVDVYVIATLYDALGNVVGVRKAPPSNNVILKGGEAPFHLNVMVGGGPVDRFEVQADGLRIPTPTPGD